MSGMPLNGRLTERGGRLVGAALTAPCYHLYALGDRDENARPGLVRVGEGGASVEVEVWELSPAALGALAEEVPGPLAVGHVELSDGEPIAGFVCEGRGAEAGSDITAHGGWRAYLEAATARRA
jgi:allophanate hydrolase